MKFSFSLFSFIGFIFVSIFGTLLHFVYDWTCKNSIAALFSGVNESTWEHMKLLFFPLFIFAVFQWFFFKGRYDFWCIKLIGTVFGLLMIPIIFYTYNGVFGKSPDWINITIFFIAAALVFISENFLFSKNLNCRFPFLPFLTLCFIGISFFAFTFYPPKIPLFMDPITGGFGI